MSRKSLSLFVSMLAVVATAFSINTNPTFADRLSEVKEADQLHCGVVPGVPRYAFPNKEGKWSALILTFAKQ